MSDKIDRRLAAVLVADIAGYSALMGADDEGTVATLKAHQAVILPMVEAFGGRIVDLAGDGILAQFPSALGAVEAAVAMQAAMRTRNEGVEPGRLMQFRMGVNQGDIVQDGGRIYGDGINVAARIQALAQPGCICISGKVRDEIIDRADVEMVPIGNWEFKNIARPVPVFAIAEASARPGPARAETPPPSDHSTARRPSVAVLPFTNMSGDAEQEYFADGVVEDILIALSRFKSFAVVARSSSFVYKGRTVDVRQVGREVGVRYVLEGSVRRAGDRLRITAQLVDSSNGAHLWAGRYDGKIDDVFDFQDRITESVVGVVEPHIREAEIERSRRDRPGSIEAYDLYLRAIPRFRLGVETSNREAYHLLVQALGLEPDNPTFLAEASRIVERVLVLGWSPLSADDRAACADYARRGLARAGNDAAVLATSAVSLMSATGDVQVGMATIQRALALNPNQSRVLLSAGIAHLHHGSLTEAIDCFERNMRLSPASPSAYVSMTGVAHAQMALGRYAEALATAEQSLALNADYVATFWMLVSANAHLGRMAQAQSWLRQFLRLEPKASISQIRAAQPFDERVRAILEGLASAGLPE